MGYTKAAGESVVGDRAAQVKRVLWIILFLNLAVAVAKYAYGVMSGSAAMQADGIHSLFDGSSNIIGIIGMTIAARPADGTHPYGHSKYETYASAVIGVMLVFAAYNIGATAVSNIALGEHLARVDVGSFVVMVVTLVVNIGVTLWEHRAGDRLGSAILKADAKHTLSDVLVSVSVIIGLIFVRLGYPEADSISALLVSVAILWTAWGVFRQASATLSDSARMPVERIREVASGVTGVLGSHDIRTRGSEAEVYVDLHIQVDGNVSVFKGHGIAEEVERTVASAFPQVVDVIVHLEPYDAYQQCKTDRQLLGETVSPEQADACAHSRVDS